MSACRLKYSHRMYPCDRLMPERFHSNKEAYAVSKAKEDADLAVWLRVCNEVEAEFGYDGDNEESGEEVVRIERDMEALILERWRKLRSE